MPRPLHYLVLTALLVGAVWVYLSALDEARFGFYHDDGIYAVTAKALASGEGYRIISLPYEPAQTKYPPFYPYLLSWVWRTCSDFPGNLPWLMGVNILLMLFFLVVTFLYLVVERHSTPWPALMIVGLVAFNWRSVILATNLLSEVVYALLAVAAIWSGERHLKNRGPFWEGACVGILGGLLILTRSVGLAWVAAWVLYCLWSRRLARAFLPAVVGLVFFAGWTIWSAQNPPPVDHLTAAYYTSYTRDFQEVLTRLGGESDSTWLALAGVVVKNAFMLFAASVPMICLGLDYNWLPSLDGSRFFAGLGILFLVFGLIARGFLLSFPNRLPLLHLFAFFQLAIHIPWPYTSYDRFAWPVLPFLYLFLLIGLGGPFMLRQAAPARQPHPAWKNLALSVGLLGLMTAVAGPNLAGGLLNRLDREKSIWQRQDGDNRELVHWIRENTQPDEILVCYRDPIFYLHTQRKAVRSYLSKSGQELAPEAALLQVLEQIIEESDGRYLVHTSYDFDQEADVELLRESLESFLEISPLRFTPVFQTTSGDSGIYRIVNHPSESSD